MKDINVLVNSGINVQNSLELLGDMETYNETLNDFLSEVEEKLSQITQYKNTKDMPNYAILVHSLKSDSKYLGFTKLAELAYNHEMSSKENNVSYVEEHFEELMTEARRIVAVVKNYCMGDASSTVTNASSSTSASEEGKKKILIADDSDIIRHLVQKILGEHYDILNANDGREAVQVIEAEKDNLVGILLDLKMPNVDGFQVLEYMKNNNLLSKIKVAVVTGDDSRETVLKAFDYPIVDVLAKPFNESDVKRVVTAMVNY